MVEPRLVLSPLVESVLACPRCRVRLDGTLYCGNCAFYLGDSHGVLVCGPESRGHPFANYSLESGVPQYTASDLHEHEYYLRFFPPAARIVVDCGGGDANASALWARRHPEAELIVADMDEFALRKAVARRLPNLTPLRTSVLALPFTNTSVDVIFTTFMVEHLYDWELSRFYLEAWRVLEVGGTLIVQSDAAFFDKFIHPVLRVLKGGSWRTSRFLDRWKTDVVSVHHHNLKTAEAQQRFIKEHGFFLQGMEVPLLFSNRGFFAAIYEVLNGIFPAGFINRFLGTSYTVVATKRSE